MDSTINLGGLFMAYCSNCGEFLPDGIRFCTKCGAQQNGVSQTVFCKYCGKQIPKDAVICTYCGRQVEELRSSNQPLIINNSAAASASSVTSVVTPGKVKKKYNAFLDLILIFCTAGLWLIVMAVRPKYE